MNQQHVASFTAELVKISKEQRRRPIDAAVGGASAYGGYQALNHGLERTLGVQRVLHGTSRENRKKILKEGLLPSHGGTSAGSTAKAGADGLLEATKDRVYVARGTSRFGGRVRISKEGRRINAAQAAAYRKYIDGGFEGLRPEQVKGLSQYFPIPARNVAGAHASIHRRGGPILNMRAKSIIRKENKRRASLPEKRLYGASRTISKKEESMALSQLKFVRGFLTGSKKRNIVGGSVPYEEFRKNFHVDPDWGSSHAMRSEVGKGLTKKQVTRGIPGAAHIIKNMDRSTLKSYIKKYPGRFKRGLGFLGVAGALGAVSASSLKRFKGKKEE